jgi:hypothetical protein
MALLEHLRTVASIQAASMSDETPRFVPVLRVGPVPSPSLEYGVLGSADGHSHKVAPWRVMASDGHHIARHGNVRTAAPGRAYRRW